MLLQLPCGECCNGFLGSVLPLMVDLVVFAPSPFMAYQQAVLATDFLDDGAGSFRSLPDYSLP
jgi:hypothetical protein